MVEGLCYTGVIKELSAIPDADRIMLATVVCGKGGKWRGVVKKDGFNVDDPVLVYLPDSVLPPEPQFDYMAKHKYRVKVQRYRGAPSECLIDFLPYGWQDFKVGEDVTERMNVRRHFKVIPANMMGIFECAFPGFIPKTDEPNWQGVPELVAALAGNPYVVTEKLDGTSCTVYRREGKVHVCSRNWQLQDECENIYWQMARKYHLDRDIPEGVALQMEICGPKIQGNSMGLTEYKAFLFDIYDIEQHRYYTPFEFEVKSVNFEVPKIRSLGVGAAFDPSILDTVAQQNYPNGHPMEGVVIRAYDNDTNRISFKVLNLDYKD